MAKYTPEDIQRIHARSLAVQNQLYPTTSGLTYIGLPNGRLRLQDTGLNVSFNPTEDIPGNDVQKAIEDLKAYVDEITLRELAENYIFVGDPNNEPNAVLMSGDATIDYTGSLTLANTAVTPGAYTNADITVDSKGRIIAAANGTSGDVNGPGSSIDGNIVLFDGVTGKLIKDSGFASTDNTFLRRLGGVVNFGSVNANFFDGGYSNGNILSTDGSGNLVWGNPATAPVIGVGVTLWPTQTAIVTGPDTPTSLYTLTTSPTVGGATTSSAVVNNNTVLIDAHLYDTALGVTSIPSGAWIFNIYAAVSNTGQTNQIITSVCKVVVGAGTATVTGAGTTRTVTVSSAMFSAGDYNADIKLTSYIQLPDGFFPISGYTSSTVVTITVPNAYVNTAGVAYNVHRALFSNISIDIISSTGILYQASSAQPAFAVNATDKLSLLFFGYTNANTNRTITYYQDGNTENTSVTTPLVFNHNQLQGLQGGATSEYYHLTSSEHTKAVDLLAKWTAASASSQASLQFYEDTDNGTNKVTLESAASLSADYTVTLPSETGTLITDQDNRLKSIKIFDKENTTQTVTGTLTETILCSLDCPIMGANDVLFIESLVTSSASGGTKDFKMYLGPTDNSLVGATQIALLTHSTGTRISTFVRHFANKNSVSSNEIRNTGLSLANDYNDANANIALTTLNIDMSSQKYLIISVTLANTGDTATLRNAQLYWGRA